MVEKYRHVAEVHLLIGGVTIQGKGSTREKYVSIDQAFGKVSRQIRRRKGKLTARRPVTPMPSYESKEGARQHRTKQLITSRPPMEVLTTRDAVECLQEGPTALLVFWNPSAHRVQVLRRLDRGEVQLIDPQPERMKGL